QPRDGMTAQGEVQSRNWSYITMQPGSSADGLHGQTQLDAATQIIHWAQEAGQRPEYFIFQAWPFYSPVNGWGQASQTGPWQVTTTYSDLWNRGPETFSIEQFEMNIPVFNFLNLYFDIFFDKLQSSFPHETIHLIPVGEVFARIDALALATNSPPGGPNS